MTKILHENLQLGSRGEGYTLKIFGSGGVNYNSSITFEVPDTDFVPVIYQLPSVNQNGYLKNSYGILSWDSVSVDPLERYDLTESSRIENAVPAATKLVEVVVFNNEDHDVTVNCGISLHGEDILSGYVIPADGWVQVAVGRYYSKTAATDIYVESDDFTTEGVTVILEKKSHIAP